MFLTSSIYCLWFQAKQRSFALEQRHREIATAQSKQVELLQYITNDVSISHSTYFDLVHIFSSGRILLLWVTKVSRVSLTTTFCLLQDLLVFLPVGSPLSLSSSIPSSLAATPPSPAPLGHTLTSISSGMNANALPFYPTSETVESVVGKSTFWIHITKL